MNQDQLRDQGCMAGCDRSPRDPAVMMTPGQLLHRLHTIDVDGQLDLAQRILEAQEQATRCFAYGHDARLAEWDDRLQMLLWLHAEASWWLQLDRDEHESAEVLHMWSRRVAYLEARVGQLKNTIGELRAETVRLRREVEFEANGAAPVLNGLSLPVCACSIDFSALDSTRWCRPVCAVHPEEKP